MGISGNQAWACAPSGCAAGMKKGSPQGALVAAEAAGAPRRRQPAVLLAPILGAVFKLQTMVTARMPITTPSDTITGIL
jgi:hypothetical protein